jgi:glycosyltransferase involved in cell wall biosynthesis
MLSFPNSTPRELPALSQRTTKRPSLSVFFPVFNDWGTIGSLLITADLALRRLTNDYEIIAVNDGSTDTSADILRELSAKIPRLRVVTHPRNRGYGGALRSGFGNARKDFVFYTDSDGQYDVKELALLVDKIRPGVDVVNGYKIRRNDPLHRKIVGRVYHWAVKIAFGLPIRDTDCDFRLIRRSVFKKVQLVSNSGVICVEMVKKIHDAGFRFVEVPVHHFWRISGKSQFFNFKRVFKTLLDLFRLWIELVVQKKGVR